MPFPSKNNRVPACWSNNRPWFQAVRSHLRHPSSVLRSPFVDFFLLSIVLLIFRFQASIHSCAPPSKLFNGSIALALSPACICLQPADMFIGEDRWGHFKLLFSGVTTSLHCRCIIKLTRSNPIRSYCHLQWWCTLFISHQSPEHHVLCLWNSHFSLIVVVRGVAFDMV